jgi:eukaryotic-like serine/threonine-protein kinase
MGTVWRAHHRGLNSPVAVKFRHPYSPASVERFQNEARLAARLRGPHIVQIFDYGDEHGTPFIVMELLEGESLQTRLARVGRLELTALVRIVEQIAHALDSAHAARVVHRDIKPSNIFLVPSGTTELAKVLDFGIAKEVSGEPSTTDSGAWLGSLAYMSPEQARGQALDAATDIWSLAVVTYVAATGRQPFVGADLPEILAKICVVEYAAPSELGKDLEALDPIFEKVFQKNPKLRHAGARAFAADLARAVTTTRSGSHAPLQAIGREPAARETATAPVLATARRRLGAAPSRKQMAIALVLSIPAAALVATSVHQRAPLAREQPRGEASSAIGARGDDAKLPAETDASQAGQLALSGANGTAIAPAIASAALRTGPNRSGLANRSRALPSADSSSRAAPDPTFDPVFGLKLGDETLGGQ